MKKITKWAGLACAVACSAVVFAGCDLANTGAKDYINPDPNAQYVELNNKLYEDFITGKTWDNMVITIYERRGENSSNGTITLYKYADEYMFLIDGGEHHSLYIGTENGVKEYTLNNSLTTISNMEVNDYNIIDNVLGGFFHDGTFGMAKISEVDNVTFFAGETHILYSLTDLGDIGEVYNVYTSISVDESVNKLTGIRYVIDNLASDSDVSYTSLNFKYGESSVTTKMTALYLLANSYQG